MELEPRVDILLATFNGQKYIQAQVDSLQRQTHKNWRLLIRDDGSTDRTVEICRDAARNDDRIVVVDDGLGNLGFNLNYFRLLRLSTAAYAMFCDQDDVWLDEKISETLRAAMQAEATGPHGPLLVHCESVVTNSELSPIDGQFVGRRARHTGLRSILMANPAQGATIMVNARLRELMLLHEPCVPYDYHASLIAEATGQRVFIPKPLLMYRQHGSNAIGAGSQSGSHSRPVGGRSKLTPTLALGIHGAHAVEKTLRMVKEHWKPGVQREIERLTRLASADFSLSRLYYAVAGGFQFYRRKDRINLVLYALGLPSMPH